MGAAHGREGARARGGLTLGAPLQCACVCAPPAAASAAVLTGHTGHTLVCVVYVVYVVYLAAIDNNRCEQPV